MRAYFYAGLYSNVQGSISGSRHIASVRLCYHLSAQQYQPSFSFWTVLFPFRVASGLRCCGALIYVYIILSSLERAPDSLSLTLPRIHPAAPSLLERFRSWH